MKSVLAALGVIALLTGCGSGVKYNHDWDKTADFSQYKTYSWMPRPQAPTGDVNAQLMANDFVDKRIRAAADRHLASEGLTRVEEGGDLGVVYHTGIQDKVDVQDWGYSYSPYYYGYGGRNISVYNYQEGTLIFDLIDAEKGELVWRGSATGVIDRNASPEKMEAGINEVISRMLEDYPPQPKD